MWLNQFKDQSLQSVIAQATALKQRGFYAAAKHLLKPQLTLHPQHEALQVLYRRLELLQHVRMNQ